MIGAKHSATLEPVQGTAYAFRHDGEGSDPTDQHYSEDWTSVLKLIGDEYMTLRRYPSREDAFVYVQRQLNAARDRRDTL